jgi:cytochrome c-type biogenesis protein CcmH/NrfG
VLPLNDKPLVAIVLATCMAFSVYGQQTAPEKLIEAGHWKRARAIVEGRLRETPDDALDIFLLSQIRNAFGDYTSPLTLAEKAVALDGRVAKYHRQLAEVLGVEAQHAGVVKVIFLARRFRSEIDMAIALDPHDLQTQRDLLEYYLVAPGIAGGDIAKAAATAQHIGELDAAEGFLAKARIASFRKQTTEAEALLRGAVQSQPPSYRARVELANFYLDAEHSNPGAAEGLARDLLKLDPGRVEPYAILAQVYAGRGDWNALDALLTESSQQCADDLAPYYRAAEVLLGSGRDPARAERYLRTYLGREPEGNEPSVADARRRLGLALQLQPNCEVGHCPEKSR